MVFSFDRALSRLGNCNYRLKRISLSQYATLVNPESEVRNTILHEIAHALVGHEYGHGPVWREKARSIGCNAERTGPIAIKAEGRYQLICNSCSKVFHFHRRPKWLHRLDTIWCKTCGRAKSKGKLALKVAPEVGVSFTNKNLDKVTII